MKTKIFLSFFVMVAITFIGLARPSQPADSNTAILSGNDGLMTETQNSTQAESAQEKQEKKKTEKAKKKESKEKQDKKKKITKVSKNGKKAYVSLWVGKDDKGKKITLTGKPFVIIKKGHPEKGIALCN